MTPERWQQINRLFHAALERDSETRASFVHEAAAGDEGLEREVLSLLRSHQHSSAGYLESPAWAVAADLLTQEGEGLHEGQVLGKYRVVREVARGGMGVVYRATDEVLGRTVALKALPAEYAHDAGRRERLAREARLAARLSHRAIATVYELIEAEGRLFIASEFVQGVTLRRELDDGPLAPAHLLSTLLEIASALAAAHASGIVHRDLKPENIIRREDGQIKVLDFGLARAVSGGSAPTGTALTAAGVIAGTPGYMAPEVLNSLPADARSDIFVFGLVGWELATGRHPLGANPHTQMARLHDITAGAEPALAGPLPVPGLDRILRRCARRNPEERYPAAEAIVEDLRSLQRGAPASDGQGERLWWWQFHQRMMAVVVASTPIWVWLVRRAVERPRGTWLFFAVLALATAAVTLRLNLVFTSRVNPHMLPDHHGQAWRWIPWIEGVLSAGLVWTATMVSEQHEATAALLISLAIVVVASLAVIEPATAKGAGIAPPDAANP